MPGQPAGHAQPACRVTTRAMLQPSNCARARSSCVVPVNGLAKPCCRVPLCSCAGSPSGGAGCLGKTSWQVEGQAGRWGALLAPLLSRTLPAHTPALPALPAGGRHAERRGPGAPPRRLQGCLGGVRPPDCAQAPGQRRPLPACEAAAAPAEPRSCGPFWTPACTHCWPSHAAAELSSRARLFIRLGFCVQDGLYAQELSGLWSKKSVVCSSGGMGAAWAASVAVGSRAQHASRHTRPCSAAGSYALFACIFPLLCAGPFDLGNRSDWRIWRNSLPDNIIGGFV